MAKKKASQRKSAPKQPILSNEPKPQSEPTEVALQKQQQELARKRAERCWEKLQKIAKEDRCVISAVPYYTGDGRTLAQPMVIPE